MGEKQDVSESRKSTLGCRCMKIIPRDNEYQIKTLSTKN